MITPFFLFLAIHSPHQTSTKEHDNEKHTHIYIYINRNIRLNTFSASFSYSTSTYRTLQELPQRPSPSGILAGCGLILVEHHVAHLGIPKLLSPFPGQHLALEHLGYPLLPELLDVVYLHEPFGEARAEVKWDLRDLY